MGSARQNRARLVRFLDEKAFDPVLRASPERFESEADRDALERVKRATEREKQRYHDQYPTADEVRRAFLQDLRSEAAEKVDRDLERLGLPRLPRLHDEFLALCERLGVSP